MGLSYRMQRASCLTSRPFKCGRSAVRRDVSVGMSVHSRLYFPEEVFIKFSEMGSESISAKWKINVFAFSWVFSRGLCIIASPNKRKGDYYNLQDLGFTFVLLYNGSASKCESGINGSAILPLHPVKISLSSGPGYLSPSSQTP